MGKKEEIVAEIVRVASILGVSRLTSREFREHGSIGYSTIRYHFGSWNKAVQAAGLNPIRPLSEAGTNPRRVPDDVLLREIIRLTEEIGKVPTKRDMNRIGRFSVGTYYARWGSYSEAKRIAYSTLASAQIEPSPSPGSGKGAEAEPEALTGIKITPTKRRTRTSSRVKKSRLGEPIAFRGMRFAPTTELGVAFLFGTISRELGFVIQWIRADYPVCEGKHYLDKKTKKFEPVSIKFEFRSSNFWEHGHCPERWNLIVCWDHDWDECPIKVLELKSKIKHLPNRRFL